VTSVLSKDKSLMMLRLLDVEKDFCCRTKRECVSSMVGVF
jgi:hypothetical protein